MLQLDYLETHSTCREWLLGMEVMLLVPYRDCEISERAACRVVLKAEVKLNNQGFGVIAQTFSEAFGQSNT
jgi:hypothetical protein